MDLSSKAFRMHRKRPYVTAVLDVIALLVVFLALGMTAHATPISAGTYLLTGTAGPTLGTGTMDDSLAGTVTVGGNGLIGATDITLEDAALGNPVFDQIGAVGGPTGYDPVADDASITTTGDTAQWYLSSLTTLGASGETDLCMDGSGNCNAYQASYGRIYSSSTFGYSPADLSGGAFRPSGLSVAIASEPTSLALLGIGILSLAALTRRRALRA